jgi:hypothetical protein
MSTSVMISLLDRANTGNELLQILDSLVTDSEQQSASETAYVEGIAI